MGITGIKDVALGLAGGAAAVGGVYGAWKLISRAEEWDAARPEPSLPDAKGVAVMGGSLVGGLTLALVPICYAGVGALTGSLGRGLATYLAAAVTGASLLSYEASRRQS